MDLIDGKMHDPTQSETTGVTLKAFPVTMYKVTKEWIKNLFDEMKRTMMAQAIVHDCPKEFLAGLNALELDFSEDTRIKLRAFPMESPARKPVIPARPATPPKPESAANPAGEEQKKEEPKAPEGDMKGAGAATQ